MKMQVTDIYDDEFDEDVNKLRELKLQLNAVKTQITNLENKILSTYSSQDQMQPNEGTENLVNPEKGLGVRITYKLNRKIEPEKLEAICEELGENPKHFCNVKYDYSSTVFYKLQPAEQQRMLEAITTKRAKTAVDLL